MQSSLSLRFVRLAFGLILGLVSLSAHAAEFLVKYKDRATMNNIYRMSSMNTAGIKVLSQHNPGQYVVVDLAPHQQANIVAALVSNPNIEWVVPNFKLYAFGQPNDVTKLKDQWAIAKVQAEKAWQRATNKGRHNIVIAVIDTGVDYRHKNLAPNMIAGYDFRDNDNDPMDDTSSKNPGHGTHCAGIAAATGLIEDGIVGMSPQVSMMPLRFLGSDGSGDLNSAIRAIDYAIEKGAHVISASWGATVPRMQAQALVEAVKRADDKGVIFVAAAANDGRNNDSTEVFPANAGTPNMISVAASGSTDAKPQWSNFGKATVHMASPGEKIMSTLPGDKYGELSGTSMATPLVSGLVAFLKSQDPSLAGAQIRALLQSTGAKVEIETACKCRVDAFSAVDHLIAKRPWLVPAAATLAINETANVSVMNARAPFTFQSSNPAALTVSDAGLVTAVAEGNAIITATDADGQRISSLEFYAGKTSGGGGPGQPPGMPGECPFGDPALCEILCGIMPDAPFCKKP
jgi:thermitase